MKQVLTLLFILSLLIVGCSDSGDAPTSPNTGSGGTTVDSVSFDLDIFPLIASHNCLNSGCHGTGSSSGGMTLGSGTYTNIINASGDHGPIIVPGNANSSNMYLKLSPTPPFGSRMPLTGSPFTSTQLDLLKRWIDQGALDN